MTNLAKLATSKAIPAKALKIARLGVNVGTHNVDFLARVTGTITVGKDYDTAGTVAIPYKKAFAALCHVAGCTGKAGVNMIRRAMEIALANENNVDAKSALTEICPMVDTVEREIIQPMIDAIPRLDCKGKVTSNLEVTIRE